MNRRDLILASLAALGSAADPAYAQAPPKPSTGVEAEPFFFRDGDRVVMIGDSITEQHLHSNYVETYVRGRFPAWRLRFRNVGIGGDTSAGGNRRIARDVLSFQPTACTITFGMNDGGYRDVDPVRLAAYETGLKGILEQLRTAGVRAAVLSSSPVEKKEAGAALEGYNQTLERFAAAARTVAEGGGARFVDQFHAHVATLQRARDADPTLRINGGDPVHPGPSGQYLMAWAILKGLGAPARISTAEVDATSRRVGRTENCAVLAVKATGAGLSFIRSDRALPLWIPPAARSILDWAPVMEDLNLSTLRVSGLATGNYELRIDGEAVGRFPAAALALGINLSSLTEGPIAQQSRRLADAVQAKNQYYHDQIFRGVVLNNGVPADQKSALIRTRSERLPELDAAVDECLAIPPRQFEVIAR